MVSSAIERFLSETGRIIVINLPNRDDRRREFAAQLGKVGLSYDHPKVSLFSAIRPEDPAGFPTLGARGCFLSHLGVLRRVAASEEDRVLICEDDLDFASDLPARLDGVTRELARHSWGIFYGGYEGHVTIPAGPEAVARLDPNTGLICAHFYAVRGPAIGELIRYLEAILTRRPGDPAGGPMHYDGALSRFRSDFPNLTTLAATPLLGYQRSSRTDIHATKWFDKVPVAREATAVLRVLRNKTREA
jgi:hypothetical protein